MPGSELEQVDGAVAGAWIKPALRDGFGGYVKQQVPQIYEGYARIFHPTRDENRDEVTWAEVAKRLGTTAHREMQWHAIIGSWDSSNFRDSRWSGDDPRTGELVEGKLDPLCAILVGHTATPEAVYFGMSTIRSGVADEWCDAPQLEQPSREWVVLRGPLSAVEEIGLSNRHGSSMYFVAKGQKPPRGWEPPERFGREVPNLIWPEDRSWFVASEYDLDSTLVGGSRALIDAILAAPELEVWEVDGEVSLQSDADKLNPVPKPPSSTEQRGDDPALFWVVGKFLEFLSGEVTAAGVGEGGALEVEITKVDGEPWHLRADLAEWSPADPSPLVGRVIESIELVEESRALRWVLDDGSTFEVVPTAEGGDYERPSWRVDLPDGTTVALGSELSFVRRVR